MLKLCLLYKNKRNAASNQESMEEETYKDMPQLIDVPQPAEQFDLLESLFKTSYTTPGSGECDKRTCKNNDIKAGKLRLGKGIPDTWCQYHW